VTSDEGLKLPPHALEAVQTVGVGGLMMDNERWDNVTSARGGEEFSPDRTHDFSRNACTCWNRAKPIDLITLFES
jgi:replicative DNA helicase